MKRLLIDFKTPPWVLVFLVAGALPAGAQFLQLDQNAVLYSTNFQRGINHLSYRGAPAKANTLNPVSVDGTANQFRSVYSFSAIVSPTGTNLQVGLNYERNAGAANLNLPRGTNSNGNVTLVLRVSEAGASIFSRGVNFSFGSVITPPATDENGGPLPSGVLPVNYWFPEPYSASGHSNDLFYWSPHAQAAFATQPGPIQVTWRKLAPDVNPTTFVTILGSKYALKTENYIVSGSAAKTPRKFYWTEKSFRDTGRPVSVPTARVGTVYFHYTAAFPKTVADEFADIGQSSPVDGSTNGILKELRTIFYDSQQALIQSYNLEGRVFMELLGDATGPDTRQHLGYEIVDVARQPTPQDVIAELGDRITAYPDGRSDLELEPAPLQTGVVNNQFLYHEVVGVSGRTEYYAVRETVNQNDVLVYWLEEGVQQLRWPLLFNRYRQVWPENLGRYSHYVRPLVATEAEAQQTAVPLPTENLPTIQYQDPLDIARAKLTDTFGFYTFLSTEFPAHRTLLRFTTSSRVSFERVFSSLSTELLRPVAGTNAVDTPATVLSRFPGRASFLNLDGATGYGKLPPGVYFNGSSFTVEGWVYVRRALNWSRLIDFGNGANVDNVVVALSNGTSGRPDFYVNGDNAITTNSIPLNQWVHIATVYDSSITTGLNMLIYVNGALAGQSYMSPPRNTVRINNYVGKSNWADALADAGIDDLRIWSTARSVSQINADMTISRIAAGTAGLVAQFGFEEGGSIVYDTSGNGNNMTLFGTAVIGTEPSQVPTPGSGLTAIDKFKVPRYVSQTAYVGDRITAPDQELGAGIGAPYRAGYILQSSGISFHRKAYVDPFVSGFDLANQGAIIPVNAIPGTNTLEVWWFRRNATNEVQNESNGFKPVYWPSVIGRYTLAWPPSPDEIVLASNAGSGGLESLQAKGSIYTQNDPALQGYNPNEEHALMLGGQAYALRDDLNNVTPGANYTSQPFVLLDYIASDGRPMIHAFKVLREKPAAGILFDYIVEAGNQLQAPMPLPLLPPPVEIVTNTTFPFTFLGVRLPYIVYPTNYNSEVVNFNAGPAGRSGDLPLNWTESRDSVGYYASYASFTYRDRKNAYWVLRGVHSGLPSLEAGRYDVTSKSFQTSVTATAQAGRPFTNYIHTSRRIGSLVPTVSGNQLPEGMAFSPLKDGLAVFGTAPTPTATTTNAYTLVVSDGDGSSAVVTLNLTVKTNATVVLKQEGPLQITSTNQYTGANALYVARPPRLADPPTPTNSFVMRFYYKTQEGFAWPGDSSPPPVGTIVPYLRPVGSSQDPGDKTTDALSIVYRPVWPGNPPKLAFGETLTVPKAGKPAIRGQTSANILYQQSIAGTITNAVSTVVLHDPTREKTFLLKTNSANGLAKIPDGVRKEGYQGKTYFPNLPPHLAERFLFDPNRGPKGALVFKGQFKDELFGEKYVLLNVLAPGVDLDTVKGLCPAADPDKTSWDTAVNSLETVVETFVENPQIPGQFIVDSNKNVTFGIGALAGITNDNTAVDSYALSAAGPGQGYVTVIVGNGAAFTPPGEPVSMYVLRVTGQLVRGEIKVIASANPLNELITFQHTPDLAGKFSEYEYEWKIAPPVDGFPPLADATMSRFQPLTSGTDIGKYTLGGAGIQGLVDNYIVMRYRPMNPAHPLYSAAPAAVAANWSEWTDPALAEGWIKRVLAGINPFGQRVTDLYSHAVDTSASILIQAGKRYEGDIALNLENINNYGLIEIYETVLKRGRGLSIDAGINFGPANDALLLAAGYLNDLYMLVGNEAYADAANPTIGIGTANNTYGDIATALFAFKGQVPSLLEEELAMLRGRDDVAQPGVTTAPVYNRLVWNYTRGIDAGEVIYALNYNILDQNTDGKVDASDAAILFPQGHGDAYGHYLTAAKGYYSLLMSPSFDWVPRVEAVNVLGKPVTVDYLDERKFASAAAAVARTGRQIFDLSWRKDYLPGRDLGWTRFSTNRVSLRSVTNGTTSTNIVRHWGADQWASRAGQGAFINWVVGNAIVPAVDPDPAHEGIQKIDRTTVPELTELAATLTDLQTALDNAEGRMTPLSLPQGGLAFDINPNQVLGANAQTHFEQVYTRAKGALNNAVSSFDDAKDVTRLMRSEQDSLAGLQDSVARQELAYTNALIDLYGTPYPDDIGPGKTYKQGYEGPDYFHHMYVDNVDLQLPGASNPREATSYKIDLQNVTVDWNSGNADALNGVVLRGAENDTNGVQYLVYNLDSHGYFQKPSTWTGKRQSPGQLQQAISDVIKARISLAASLADAESAKTAVDDAIKLFRAGQDTKSKVGDAEAGKYIAEKIVKAAEIANDIFEIVSDATKDEINQTTDVVQEALPRDLIVGLANGGDLSSPARSALKAAGFAVESVINFLEVARKTAIKLLREGNDFAGEQVDQKIIGPLNDKQELRDALSGLATSLGDIQGHAVTINTRLQAYDDAKRAYQAALAQGDRLQKEREIFRQRSAAVIQGYRTRDAAFRIFRNEKLERYKTLFDLAARYTYLAANAYDYETGLLDTDKGRGFVNRIVSGRALGLVKNGEPQFAGSNTGDPGLSSVLAEMKADWDVLKGRLGFNNPDAYGTTVSLRTENLRILPGADGNTTWQDVLQRARMDNLLDDPDVRRSCLQIDPGTGVSVPGIVLSFATTIEDGANLFGRELAAGDADFHRSAFATKIFSAGVALEGYRGMNDPVANGSAVSYSGGSSTPPASFSYLDPLALASTPYVYLIPVGVDSMRSPPLGDTSVVRTWSVDDIAIPLPFNIGGSDFSTKNLYQTSDSLTEALFSIRKHQAFRPVSSTTAFTPNIYGLSGSLQPSQFTNRRLIGRSIWNSQWKLVIPGDTLLSDPKEGLNRFIRTVTDIKLYFTTYSYSGN